ncbi:MAG: 2,5-diamino-6-(ribosylamino)-4(3H)-pyrimidinone 5'-phosphate reductase [Nitrososphaera sp.]|nr:2,5-diamino-6-(ribosylamino)-4(3H)-pyrimidinone 5'-phosphate reductase [Nitrososphaera sp.]
MKVIINAAMTVDGKISTAAGDSAISSKQDLKRLHRLRADCDAVVVGISTVLADDPLLTTRLVKGKNPTRVIMDSFGRIPSDSQILKTAGSIKTLVFVTEKAALQDVQRILGCRATVIVAGVDRVDLKAAFACLKGMGIKKILVEGGGELNWSVLQQGLADELAVTVAPVIVGGRLAITLVGGDGFEKVSKGVKLKLSRCQRKKTGETILFFKVIHST